MGLLNKMNLNRRRGTLRTLDYTNVDPATMNEGQSETGRLSDSLYEGTSRVPRPQHLPDEAPAAVDHQPVRGERPHPRAQWDDVRACWVVWDLDAADWVPVDQVTD
jgi:hypothetical protein